MVVVIFREDKTGDGVQMFTSDMRKDQERRRTIKMWKDRYKIGVEKIDEQHEEFFRIISEFLFLLRMEGNWEDKVPKVKETLEFTKKYCVIHCEEEESYQKEINYPELINHKKLHDQLKNEVDIFSDRFNNEGYNEVLVQKFSSKLLYWLMNHVGVCDKQMSYFSNEYFTNSIEI